MFLVMSKKEKNQHPNKCHRIEKKRTLHNFEIIKTSVVVVDVK